MNIEEWLERLGLGEYAPAFRRERIDEDTLPGLTPQDLLELGVRPGDRAKMLASIEELRLHREGARERAGAAAPGHAWDIHELPPIIAIPLHEYATESNPVLRLWHAADAIELLLRLCVSMALADLHLAGRLTLDVLRPLWERIETPTFGKWRGMAESLSRELRRGASVVPEVAPLVEEALVPLLDGPGGEASPETSFLSLRNLLAHGGGMTAAVARRLAGIWAVRFESALSGLGWFAELAFIVRSKETFARIRGIGSDPTPVNPAPALRDQLDRAMTTPDGMAVVRGGRVLVLWPLARYGIPVGAETDAALCREDVAQVYVRRGVQLQYTPVGSEEACLSHGSAEGLKAFDHLLRLETGRGQGTPSKNRVRGFDEQIRRDASLRVGRREEIEHVLRLLAETDRGVLWLTGPAGMGKSFLLAGVCAELEDTQTRRELRLAFRFKVGDERCDRETFLRFCVERLSEDPGERECAEAPANCRPGDLLKAFRALLGNRGKERTVFILDGLDEIAERDPLFAADIPLRLGFPGVVWLCAGRPERGLHEAFSPDVCRHVFPGGLPPMTERDVRAMLLESVGPLRKRLVACDQEEGDRVVNPFIERVVEYSEGLPIYVKHVIGDVLGNRLGAFDRREASRLPPSLAAYHEELLRRSSAGTLHQVLTPLVATLAVGREPMTVDVLADLLARRHVVPDGARGIEWVQRALSAAGSMLRAEMTPDWAQGFSLMHHSLRQHMEGSASMRDALATARDSLCTRALNPGDARCPASRYLFRWGISHLAENGMRKEALRLLADFDYLMRRLRSVPGSPGIHGVSADWRLLASGGPLGDEAEVWSAFWSSREHLLAKGSEPWPTYKILLQLSWECASDSVVTRAAEKWLEDGRCDWTWMRLKPCQRPEHYSRPACIRVYSAVQSICTAVSISPSGRFFVSHESVGSEPRTIQVWSTDLGNPLRSIGHPASGVSCAAVSDDGKTVVSGSEEGDLLVFDAGDGTLRRRLQGHRGKVLSLHVDSVGEKAVSTGSDLTVRVWDLASGTCLRVLVPEERRLVDLDASNAPAFVKRGRTRALSCFLLSRSGHKACLSLHPVTRIYDLHTLAATVLPGNLRPLCLTENGEAVISKEGDGPLTVCDALSRTSVDLEESAGKKTHRFGFVCLKASHASQTVVGANMNGIVYVWDLRTGRLRQKLRGHISPVASLDIDARGSVAVSSGMVPELRLWDLGAAEQDPGGEGHPAEIKCVLSTSDGSQIISGGANGEILRWNAENGRCTGRLIGHRYTVDYMYLGDGDRRLTTISSNEQAVREWDMDTGRCVRVGTYGLMDVAIAWDRSRERRITQGTGYWKKEHREDGKLVFSGSLLFWHRGTVVRTVPLESAHPRSVGMAEDGTLAISGLSDGTVRIWDFASGQCLRTLRDDSQMPEHVGLSADGSTAIVLGYRYLLAWNWRKDEMACRCSRDDAAVLHPDFFSVIFPTRRKGDSVVDELGPGVDGIRLSGRRTAAWISDPASDPMLGKHLTVFTKTKSVWMLRVLDVVEGNSVVPET
jgi:WD40 repeat protein